MKKKPRAKVIKDLATHFEQELDRSLPVHIKADCSIVYKNYYIKTLQNGNWGLYNLTTHDKIDEFFLKTCALMASKLYNNTQLERYYEVKRLDNRYWSNYSDSLVFRKNIKKAVDFSKYQVLLNRLEESEVQANRFKDEISRMFKYSFV